LEALREAPYAFASSLADWQGDGDAEARWRQRLTDVPFNVIAELDGTPAGMVSATAPDATDALRMISMWVRLPLEGSAWPMRSFVPFSSMPKKGISTKS